MEFKVGDVVVHPTHGVGRITKLESKHLSGVERLYFEVVTQKSTVWVPADANGGATGIRRLASKRDLARYRRMLKEKPSSLDDDHRKRRLDVAERMKDGSLEGLCQLVRDLTARGWRRPLNESDSAVLRKARERLFQEWSAADGVTVSEAAREIEALLTEARDQYMH